MYCPLLSVVYHSQCIHLKLFSSTDFLEPVSRNKISTKPIFVTQSLHVPISISKILMFDLGMIARWWNLIKLQIQINLQWSSCHTKQLRFLLFFFLTLYRTSCFRTGFQYPFQYLLWNPKFLKILGDQSNILVFFIFSCHPRLHSWQWNTLLWYSYSKITKIILIQVSIAWSCSWLHSVSYSLAIKENHTLWYLILG